MLKIDQQVKNKPIWLETKNINAILTKISEALALNSLDTITSLTNFTV